MTIKLSIYQVDAFTSRLFGGNPAAVVPLQEWLSDEQMQKIAMENNLSETAFFVPEGNDFNLRWFTPTTEVDLCGHATLATAHVLFNEMNYEKDEIIFQTKSGLLRVQKDGSRLMMNFPAAEVQKTKAPAKLYEALGINAPADVFKSDDLMVVLNSEKEVTDLQPDFKMLKNIETRGVIVTAPGEEVDFVSRFFAPKVGVNEDPVTGSAHTKLIPYWSKRLAKKELWARQISKRGGELIGRVNNGRVEIIGNAITYLKGEIYIV